ncbi:MAG: hypothetical protein ACPG5T_07470, partial [Endozoicomonas sp.]
MEALVPGNNPAVTAQSSYDQEHNEAVEVLGRRINFALIDHNYMVPDDIPVGDDLSISFSGASTGQREAQSLSHVSKRMP